MAGAPTGIGFAAFAGVKAVGYTAAAAVFKHGYKALAPVKANVMTIGLARTGIGLLAGLIYGGLWLLAANQLRNPSDNLPIYYYIFLFPVRLVEWTFLIWIFFDPGLHDRVRMWKYITFGTICSYVLDAIGVGAAFVIPGGFWVC